MRVIPLYTNDNKLIQKAAKGDRRAQKQLFEKYAPKMLSVCRQYVSPLETAEELMLNGFFKVFKSLKKIEHKGSFEGWVRRIMVRECIDHLRKNNPFKFTQDLNEQLMVDEEEFWQDTDAISISTLQQIIDSLPDGCRTVFVMYALDGCKHKEIAEQLGISVNTSKTQYRKARVMLQELINNIKKEPYEA